ncbi:TolC family protein [Deinococcus lacus]|uniref:TolC family protein n=1 Tax=Deinococcus lacus TaxID=392561 RepID=A0ABW1YHX3_9DEIO
MTWPPPSFRACRRRRQRAQRPHCSSAAPNCAASKPSRRFWPPPVPKAWPRGNCSIWGCQTVTRRRRAIPGSPCRCPLNGLTGPAEADARLAVQSAEHRVAELERQAGFQLQGQGSLTAGNLTLKGQVDRRLSGSVSAMASLKSADEPTWNLGLSASLPLDGRLDRQLDAARRQLQAAQANLQAVQERAARTRSLWETRLAANAESVTLAARGLEDAQAAETIAESRYAQGLIPQAALLEARLATFKAADNLRAAQKAHDMASLGLWRAAGWLPVPAPQP